MPMISLAVVRSINQSKSMQMMSLAVVWSINQSKAYHKRSTVEAYPGSLPWKVKAYYNLNSEKVNFEGLFKDFYRIPFSTEIC